MFEFVCVCMPSHGQMYFHLPRQDTININQLIFGFGQKVNCVKQNIMIDENDLVMGTENDLI